MGAVIKKSHHEFRDSEIVREFEKHYGLRAGFGLAGRVCSGLLKAAVAAKALKKESSWGRVSGYHVVYVGPEEVFAALKEEALKRVVSREYW